MENYDVKHKIPLDDVLIRWVNWKTRAVDGIVPVEDLSNLQDGAVLCCICQNLRTFRYRKQPKTNFHKIDNLLQAKCVLDESFGEFHWTKKDLEEGNISTYRRVLLAVMRHINIAPAFGSRKSSRVHISDRQTRDVLLEWVNSNTKDLVDCSADKNWQNGLTLCALLHSYFPYLIDFKTIQSSKAETNMELAFETIKLCGIPEILAMQDFLNGIDRSCLLAFLGCLYHSFTTELAQKHLEEAGKWQLSEESSNKHVEQELIQFLKLWLPNYRFVQRKAINIKEMCDDLVETNKYNEEVLQQRIKLAEEELIALEAEFEIANQDSNKIISDLYLEIGELTSRNEEGEPEEVGFPEELKPALEAYCLGWVSRKDNAPALKHARRATACFGLESLAKQWKNKRKTRAMNVRSNAVYDNTVIILRNIFCAQEKMIEDMTSFVQAVDQTKVDASNKAKNPFANLNMVLVVLNFKTEIKKFNSELESLLMKDSDSIQEVVGNVFHQNISHLGSTFAKFANSYTDSLFTELINDDEQSKVINDTISAINKNRTPSQGKFDKISDLFKTVLGGYLEIKKYMRVYLNWMSLGPDRSLFEKAFRDLQKQVAMAYTNIRSNLAARRMEDMLVVLDITGKKESQKFREQCGDNLGNSERFAVNWGNGSEGLSKLAFGTPGDTNVHWKEVIQFKNALIQVKRKQLLIKSKRLNLKEVSRVRILAETSLKPIPAFVDEKTGEKIFGFIIQNPGEKQPEAVIIGTKDEQEKLHWYHELLFLIKQKQYTRLPIKNPKSTDPPHMLGKLQVFNLTGSGIWQKVFVRIHQDSTCFFKKLSNNTWEEFFSIPHFKVLRMFSINKNEKWLNNTLSFITPPSPGIWVDALRSELNVPGTKYSYQLDGYNYSPSINDFNSEIAPRIVDCLVNQVLGISPKENSSNKKKSLDIKCCDDQQIPIFIIKTVKYLRELGLKEKGIMRIPGNVTRVKELLKLKDDSSDWGIDEKEYKINDVATAFKTYLRELQTPLLAFQNYSRLCNINGLDEKNKLRAVQLILLSVPQQNRAILKYVFDFLKDVMSYEEFNKMGPTQVATCLGLSVIRTEVATAPVDITTGDSLANSSKETDSVNEIFKFMVLNMETIFEIPSDVIGLYERIGNGGYKFPTIKNNSIKCSSVGNTIIMEYSHGDVMRNTSATSVLRYNKRQSTIALTIPTKRATQEWAHYFHEFVANLL